MVKRSIQVLAVVLALVSFPSSILFATRVRSEQRQAVCVDNQKQWDTLHELIEETGRPSPTGSALELLIIPEDTPPSVVEILRQLNATEAKPPNLDRFYAVLGDRPRC
jgi:hypothetical protein